MTCPACGSAAVRPSVRMLVRLPTRMWPVRVRACRTCTHRFLETTREVQREIETGYGGGYAGFRPDPVFEAVIRREVAQRLVPSVAPPARVLDVGCGNGSFLAAAREAGYDAHGVDVSTEAARLCRERGLDAEAGDFLTLPLRPPYDLVTLWDVVEHLREPAAFLSRARELLAPGGAVVLKVPGFGAGAFALIGARPALAGMMLGAPSHVQYFNPRSMRALLERTGLGEVTWFPSFSFRSPPRAKNPLKRAAVRAVRWLGRVGGNRTLYLLARAGG